jgi:beta-phosphoglucomutase
MIKAVIFDLDGVITDGERSRFELLKKMLAAKGVPMNDNLFSNIVGIRTMTFLKKYFSAKLSQTELSEIYARRLSEFKEHPEKYIIPMPYIKECVEKLSLKYRLAIGSSNKISEIEQVLNFIGIRDKFEILVGSNLVENPKPAPDIYLAAVQKLNLTNKNCIAVEDSPIGIEAAKAAGLYCIAVTYTTPRAELQKTGADLIIESLKELPELLNQM